MFADDETDVGPGLRRDDDATVCDDERAVFAELLDIVDDVIALYHADNKPLPPAAALRFIDATAK